METILTLADLKLFTDISYKELGIKISDAKRELMSNRLSRRLKALALGTFRSYYDYLITQPEIEMPYFTEVVTTNETYFFRGPKHFRSLSEEVLPFIKSSRVTAWSAACSSGEEPYSLIIALLKRLPGIEQRKIEVYGSGISHKVLKKASEGIYQSYAMRYVEEKYRRKYFTLNKDGDHQVKPLLRGLLKLGHHNLMHSFPGEAMDIIFCRNVLIYFDDHSKKVVFDNLVGALKPGGVLFLGESEIIPEIKGLKKVNSYMSKKL